MEYNGWKNRKTWNVAMHLGNDEALYNLIVYYGKDVDYFTFARTFLLNISNGTSDGVAWDDEELDYDALTELLEEIG